MLTYGSHHRDAFASTFGWWVLDGFVNWGPGLPVSQPQIEGCLVEVHQRPARNDYFRKLDGKSLTMSGDVRREWLAVSVANCLESNLVTFVEPLETFRCYFEIKVSFKQHASLLEIVTTPGLEQVPVEHTLAELRGNLTLRIILPIVECAVIYMLASFSVALQRSEDGTDM